MSILIVSARNTDSWVKAFRTEDPDIDLKIYPEEHNREEIEFALVWNHPHGLFKDYPNLKVIASMGAGVDHILRDPELPENVVITRIVDEHLAGDMAEFVLALVMNHLRNLPFYKNRQALEIWQPVSYRRISEITVGLMGMGVLGTSVAEKLQGSGFNVQGWVRTSRDNRDSNIYVGSEELDDFLGKSQILICLLPLTPLTEGILNRELFEKLPQNAYIINVARGGHLIEEDLLQMIGSGHLSGAALDVFRTEPLPPEHAFWKNPSISITPHIASVTNPFSVVSQILDNFELMKQGKELKNIVARKNGY